LDLGTGRGKGYKGKGGRHEGRGDGELFSTKEKEGWRKVWKKKKTPVGRSFRRRRRPGKGGKGQEPQPSDWGKTPNRRVLKTTNRQGARKKMKPEEKKQELDGVEVHNQGGDTGERILPKDSGGGLGGEQAKRLDLGKIRQGEAGGIRIT